VRVVPGDPGMGKGEGEGDGEVEEQLEQETSGFLCEQTSGTNNNDEEWRDYQEDAQASAEKARERFENEVRNICATIQLVVVARQDTIAKLERAADYLDSVWLRCRVSKTMGTSVSLVGGGLTIAGGILTVATAGVATPVLIAGIATSSVGAATNIGTSIVEKLLNSKQVKDLNAAFERDKMLTTKFERQIEEVKRHQDSPHLSLLYYSIKQFLGADHLLMAILKEVLLSGLVDGKGEEDKREPASLMKQESKDGVQYNPLDAGALVEGGKVIGQNSFKMAGQVIIGVSAAFLVWDAIDLGFTISDLVRKKGSQSAKVLRDKATMLRVALEETAAEFCLDMPE